MSGVVKSRESGSAVAGAVVSIEGIALTTTSDPLGRFRFEGVPGGRKVVTVRATGFLDGRGTEVQVLPGADAQVAIELDPTPNFLDRVR